MRLQLEQHHTHTPWGPPCGKAPMTETRAPFICSSCNMGGAVLFLCTLSHFVSALVQLEHGCASQYLARRQPLACKHYEHVLLSTPPFGIWNLDRGLPQGSRDAPAKV